MSGLTMNDKLLLSDELLDVYKKLGEEPLIILKNYALDMVMAKIQKYEAESKKFSKQYHTTFSRFKKKVESIKQGENFRWEEDLLDWQFAEENLKYWKKVLKNIKSA